MEISFRDPGDASATAPRREHCERDVEESPLHLKGARFSDECPVLPLDRLAKRNWLETVANLSFFPFPIFSGHLAMFPQGDHSSRCPIVSAIFHGGCRSCRYLLLMRTEHHRSLFNSMSSFFFLISSLSSTSLAMHPQKVSINTIVACSRTEREDDSFHLVSFDLLRSRNGNANAFSQFSGPFSSFWRNAMQRNA